MQEYVTQELRYRMPPRGKRFLAFVIDLAILVLLLIIFRKPFIKLIANLLNFNLVHETQEEFLRVEKFYSAVDALLGLPLVILVYLVPPLIFKKGQTVGKKIMGLILIHKNGSEVTTLQVFLRALIGIWVLEYVTSILFYFSILILSVVFALVNKQGMAIHDVIARTIVVEKEPILVDVIKKHLPPLPEIDLENDESD